MNKKLAAVMAVVVLIIAAEAAYVFTWRQEAPPVNPPAPAPVTPAPAPAPAPVDTSRDDLIRVGNPKPGQLVTSPLTVTGEARGNWYFEAVFPIRLLDGNGAVIASGQGQATADWMTSDFVPFTSTLTFAAPATANGTLVLMKDNPSGLPEYDDEIRIPVRFAKE